MSSSIVKLTNQDGYIPWTHAVEDAILTAGAMAALEQTAPEKPVKPVPLKDEKPSPAELSVYQEEFRYYNAWMEKDEKARGVIQRSISAGLRMKLKNSNCTTAKQQWDRLAKLHQVDDDDYRADIRSQLETITLSDGDDVDKFVERFESLLCKAETVKLSLSDSEKCSYFLRSLPAKYRNLKSEWRILTSGDESSKKGKDFDALSDLFNVHVAELRREDDKNKVTGVAMFTSKSKSGNATAKGGAKTCWNCGKKGHTNRDCRAKKVGEGTSFKPARKPARNTRNAFTESGPTDDDMLALFGPDKSLNAFTQAPSVGDDPYLMAAISQMREASLVWMFDTGASDHVCNDKNAFYSIRKLSTPQVYKTVGNDISLTECGSVTMELEGGRSQLRLDHVLYHPSAPANLLSCGALREQGWKFDLLSEPNAMFRGRARIPLVSCGPSGRLSAICLPLAKPVQPSAFLILQEADTVEGWHKRLAHVGVSTILTLAKRGRIRVTNASFNTFKMEDCDVCARAKATRLSFGDLSVRAKRPLEIVHSDIAGPLKPSNNGHVYYVTFIDDYTGLLFCNTMDNKMARSVLQSFRWFHAATERAFGAKIEVIRTDNGSEYKGEMGDYVRRCGIVHQVTTPYTPQLNGRAERMNRTLKEMTAAMLIDAAFDMAYWPFALQYASILWNHALTFEGVSLEEKVYKRRLDYAKMHAFGTSCWVRVDDRLKADLTVPKAVKGRLLSPNLPGTGYIVLLDGEQKKIVTSRDVVFQRSSPDVPFIGPLPAPQPVDETAPPEPVATVDPVLVPVSDGLDTASGGNDGEQPAAAAAAENNAVVETPEDILDIPVAAPEPRRSPRIASLQFLLLATSIEADSDPLSYQQAMNSPSSQHWIGAIERELDSVEKTGTWLEVHVPEGVNLVGSKWVFRRKINSAGIVVKYKARVVAQGFTQVEGEDYDDTYSPVARLTSLRMLLAIVAADGLLLFQMDADTAFLNGTLSETIYMRFPPGYKPKNANATGLRLIRSLYGLKQSPRVWWQLISNYLVSIGFHRLNSDWGLYVRHTDQCYLLLYVDDVLIAAPSMKIIDEIKRFLTDKWKWSDIGEAAYILGLKIERDLHNRVIRLKQAAYIEGVLDRFGMKSCNPVSTPVENFKLVKLDTFDPDSVSPSERGAHAARRSLYQAIVGSIMWCAISTRPDLAFVAGYLSRFNSNPGEDHLKAAKRVLQYLKGSLELGLTFGMKHAGNQLIGFSDADYAGDLDTRRSTTGYVFKFRGSVISWGSVRQATVAVSTCEAEYMALTEAYKEGTWLFRLLQELHQKVDKAFVIWCDNRGAISLTANPGHHKRTKHIDIRYHLIREAIEAGKVEVLPIGTRDQAADILTKALKAPLHHRACQLVHLL